MSLVRVDSADRNQYYSDYQWQTWSYSSCSGIAMEMVMNAYGRHLIASDVLQVELNLGVWSVSEGLLRDEGVAMTANYFGFNTDAGYSRTLQDLITISNKGFPIVVSVRDSYYFPAGHLFVVRGGDSQYVYIADSAPTNFQRMSHALFLGMWHGFSAILTPR
jgi:ABC-type bacteriocin/lantibiotic exporter with double-glycine peptidase domain